MQEEIKRMLDGLDDAINNFSLTQEEKQTLFENNIRTITAETIDEHRDEIYVHAMDNDQDPDETPENGDSDDDVIAGATARSVEAESDNYCGTKQVMVCSLCGGVMESDPELKHVCIQQVSSSLYLETPGFVTIDDAQLQVIDADNVPVQARKLMTRLIMGDKEINSMLFKMRELQITRAGTNRSVDMLHACEKTQSRLSDEKQRELLH